MPTRFCCEPGGCWPYGGCFCPIPVCSPCCCPCLPCPCPPIPPVDPPDFSIVLYKRDRITKAPLEGAEYLLKQGDRIWSSRSDASGRLSFDVGEPGNYRLLETQAPAGYQTQSGFYVLTVRPNGDVLLNGAPIPEDSLYDLPLGRLAFLKYDVQTGLPLMNAQFQLSDGKTAHSDANGLVDFGVLSPGTYMLEETAPPQGYLPNQRIYIVTVDAAQNIDIDGVSLSNFAIRNQKLPDLAFQKTDVQTGQPLAGARFQLSDGTLATADSNGWVNFGVLPPGNYAFTELDAPKGFLSSKNTHFVVIDNTYHITVDGEPLSSFTLNSATNFVFQFHIMDGATGRPLSGATFSLSNGCRAQSDAQGRVNFGRLSPGIYHLRETSAPRGYLHSPHVYTVQVYPDGRITVDQLPLSAFTAASDRRIF